MTAPGPFVVASDPKPGYCAGMGRISTYHRRAAKSGLAEARRQLEMSHPGNTHLTSERRVPLLTRAGEIVDVPVEDEPLFNLIATGTDGDIRLPYKD